MEEFVDCLEYYYDEDFSVPFDIGITEENNNTNNNYLCRGVIKYNECSDEEYEYHEREIQKVIVPVNLFFNDYTKRTIDLRRSVNVECKRPRSPNQSITAKMSCSSSTSPASSTSIRNDNDDKNTQSFMMESHYSLKSRLPLFTMDNGKLLANYHLSFVPTHDYLIDSQIMKTSDNSINNEAILTSSLSDSGKYSATTVDSMLLQQVANDYKTLHGIESLDKQNLKPESRLWRQIKFLMTYYYAGWSLIKIFKQSRNRSKQSQAQSTDEIYSYQTHKTTRRIQRHSCTVLEIYNVIKDSDNSYDNIINCKNTPASLDHPTNREIQHFSCQFPPKNKSIRTIQKQNAVDHYHSPKHSLEKKLEYPGIGHLNVPKPARLKSTSFLCNEFHSQLSFLQSSLNSLDTANNKTQTTSDYTVLKPCLRKEDQLIHTNKTSSSIDLCRKSENQNHFIPPSENQPSTPDKRKSVSFDCPELSVNSQGQLRQIPKKWGLLGLDYRHTTDLMAMFECSDVASMLKSPKNNSDRKFHPDDTMRIKTLVSEACRAVRQISERLSHNHNLTSHSVPASHGSTVTSSSSTLSALCEQLYTNSSNMIECWDSPLATAIDSVFTLLADGLVSSSSYSNSSTNAFVSNINRRSAAKLWVLVEETCRHTPELHTIVRDSAKNSSNSHLQKVRMFLARTIRANLLHVWIGSLANNEAALSRFYQPSAFLRYAPTRHGENSLESLTSCLKSLQQFTQAPPAPPPVTIARRLITNHHKHNHQGTGARSYPTTKQQCRPLYSTAVSTTESESFAEETPPSSSHYSESSPSASTSNPNPTSLSSAAALINRNRDATNNNHHYFIPKHPKSTIRKSHSSNVSHKYKQSALLTTPSSTSKPINIDRPPKSYSNLNCNNLVTNCSNASSVSRANNLISLPLKTIRTQPLVSRTRNTRPDKLT